LSQVAVVVALRTAVEVEVAQVVTEQAQELLAAAQALKQLLMQLMELPTQSQ
jgi:hypothetical protein